MDWIKRNLGFVIGSLVALLLMGGAGYYFYSTWKDNGEVLDKLKEQYAKLDELNRQNPHPGRPPQSDNISLAKQQQGQLKDFLKDGRKAFEPIANIPEGKKITDQEFRGALLHTIDQLQKAATNSSVGLPASYFFSFAAQIPQMKFNAGTLEPLASELGEIKAICDVLFQAKINSLESLKRERVAPEDSNGAQSDYLNQKSVTNELAILTPYEIRFRCFTPELAAAVSGFANSPHGLVVKTINVEQAPAVETPAESTTMAPPTFVPPPVVQQPTPEQNKMNRAAEEAQFRRRYGLDGRRPLPNQQPAPQVVAPVPQAVAPVAQPAKGGLPTILDEKQLMVTVGLNVVKLLPPAK